MEIYVTTKFKLCSFLNLWLRFSFLDRLFFKAVKKIFSNLHNDSNDENFAAAETGVVCEFLHMWRQKQQPTIRHDREETQHLKRRLKRRQRHTLELSIIKHFKHPYIQDRSQSDLPYAHVGHRGRKGLVEELAELVGVCADLCDVVEQ